MAARSESVGHKPAAGRAAAGLVATRDLAAGVELTADDGRLENPTAATVPDGSQSVVDAVIGATLAENALLDLVRPRDVVDVLATGADACPRLVATVTLTFH
ncbi:MAG TPA: SAF domain-containing protein [Mycobacterium sp.]|nr:SAF domain-containing protein [Mycobacterium sp.]